MVLDDNDLPQAGFVTVQWVRKRYAVSNSTLYNWIAEGRIAAPVKIGKRAVRFLVDDLREFEAALGSEARHARKLTPAPFIKSPFREDQFPLLTQALVNEKPGLRQLLEEAFQKIEAALRNPAGS